MKKKYQIFLRRKSNLDYESAILWIETVPAYSGTKNNRLIKVRYPKENDLFGFSKPMTVEEIEKLILTDQGKAAIFNSPNLRLIKKINIFGVKIFPEEELSNFSSEYFTLEK